ncbi:hypothetical protein RKD37_000195 [Streptomyces ambofaciens]
MPDIDISHLFAQTSINDLVAQAVAQGLESAAGDDKPDSLDEDCDKDTHSTDDDSPPDEARP